MISNLDWALFRFFNGTLASGWLDPVMAFLSGNAVFIPAVVLLAVGLVGWGGRRGRTFVVMLTLVLALGDTVCVGWLKKVIGRPRPFTEHPEVRLLAGRGTSYSMPSGHAAIWGAVTVMTLIYYRRRWMPVAAVGLGVGISRMYLGVHYPSDVLAGWAIGAAYAVVLSRMGAWVWGVVGRRCFPEWHAALPDLLRPEDGVRTERVAHGHWERLGWCLLVGVLVARWVLVGIPVIDLSEDEAYQWMWSKRLEWSYYSKPFGIALAHWIGTHLWGDTEFGVRFLPPLLGAILGGVLLRFVARRTDGRTAFLFTAAALATPLLAVGSLLLTIDPLTVFFYTLGMLAAWRAVTEDSTGWWVAVGASLGATLLTKYFAPFQLVSLLMAMAVVPGAWRQWRRPGPYLALGILLLSTVPILMWNREHGWVAFVHLKERGGLHQEWHFKHQFLTDFVLSEVGLLNPVWFGMTVMAVWAVWLRRGAPVLERFLASFCAPVFLFYLGYTVRSRVHANWIAAAVLPGMLVATLYWHRRWQSGCRAVWGWVRGGLWVGLPLVVLLHNTDWIGKLTGHPLPDRIEPTKRVHGHRDFGAQVAQVRTNLMAEGKPVFIVADHYGRAGLLSFYYPGAPETLPDRPFIYELATGRVASQFALWPGYGGRRGETALFVRQEPDDPAEPLPKELWEQFETVERLKTIEVRYRGRLFHRYDLVACRGKK